MVRETQKWFIFCNLDRAAPLLTEVETKIVVMKFGLRENVLNLGIHYSELLDFFNDGYRDWPGYFIEDRRRPENSNRDSLKEVFVDMDPLYEAPVEWWRDTFGPKALQNPIIRVRCEALPRWCALGSLFYAWYPNQKPAWLGAPANDNMPSPHR